MKKWILLCVALLLALAGCDKQPEEEKEQENTQQLQQEQIETTEQAEQTQAEPAQQAPIQEVPIQEGGTLYLSMRNTTTLNPLLNQDESVDTILKLIYMPLIRLDKNHKPAPSIAQSWSFDEGGTVLTLNLRNDIYWQNGTNLTADDVIYSFNTLQRSADTNAVYKSCMNYIRSYRKTSAYSVEIIFNQNFSGNMYTLLMPIRQALNL